MDPGTVHSRKTRCNNHLHISCKLGLGISAETSSTLAFPSPIPVGAQADQKERGRSTWPHLVPPKHLPVALLESPGTHSRKDVLPSVPHHPNVATLQESTRNNSVAKAVRAWAIRDERDACDLRRIRLARAFAAVWARRAAVPLQNHAQLRLKSIQHFLVRDVKLSCYQRHRRSRFRKVVMLFAPAHATMPSSQRK
jgi:hypothetical protein